MKKLLFFVAALATTAILFSSCSKDNDDDTSGTVKVQYKLIGSADANLSSVIFLNASGDMTSNSSLSGNTWTSAELTVPRSLRVVSFTGTGMSNNPDAQLRGQILINGEVVKDNTSTGTALVVSLSTEL